MKKWEYIYIYIYIYIIFNRLSWLYLRFKNQECVPRIHWTSIALRSANCKCSSISITVWLSYVAVRSGPKDAKDFVSTIFRNADWTLTSPLCVTIFQLSDFVVKILSTHSNFLNSLSSFHEKLSCLSICVIVFYLFESKRMIHSFFLS